MKNLLKALAMLMCAIVMFLAYAVDTDAAEPTIKTDGTLEIAKRETPKQTQSTKIIGYWGDSISLTDEEYELLCRVICLEDGGESEYSQRCVASVIYNRLISGWWGTTLYDVLYADGQFEVMPHVWDSDVNPSETTRKVVSDVFNGNVAIPCRVKYFRTGYFFGWARAEFNVGNVYFSSSWYEWQ